MQYKAIGFDYGGVITGKRSSVISKNIVRILGVSEGAYHTAYYHHNSQLNSGLISVEELWGQVLAELKLTDKKGQILSYLAKQNFDKADDDLLRYINMLRHDGYRIGLLSNNTAKTGEKIKRSNLVQYFDVINISAETGYVKPDPNAFINFVRELGVKIEELIFIDDSKKSLSTAKQTGYTPFLYKGYSDMVRQLEHLNVPNK